MAANLTMSDQSGPRVNGLWDQPTQGFKASKLLDIG